jgi:hypothetical protein
MKSNLNK